MKVGDKVRMSHPGKRDGEVGIIRAINIPLDSHKHNNVCDPCTCGIHLDVNGESWKINKTWVEPVTVTRRTCEFIEVHRKPEEFGLARSIYVPTPSSFYGGWARHQWLKGYFGQECCICSQAFWDVIIERHGQPKTLVEEDGVFRVEE